jgi:hypothetical protein
MLLASKAVARRHSLAVHLYEKGGIAINASLMEIGSEGAQAGNPSISLDVPIQNLHTGFVEYGK